jgi:hypothetical protein
VWGRRARGGVAKRPGARGGDRGTEGRGAWDRGDRGARGEGSWGQRGARRGSWDRGARDRGTEGRGARDRGTEGRGARDRGDTGARGAAYTGGGRGVEGVGRDTRGSRASRGGREARFTLISGETCTGGTILSLTFAPEAQPRVPEGPRGTRTVGRAHALANGNGAARPRSVVTYRGVRAHKVYCVCSVAS